MSLQLQREIDLIKRHLKRIDDDITGMKNRLHDLEVGNLE